MTQEAETVAMELNIVSCQTCDALFIESERRQTCPSCGGPPVGPYFRFVLDGAGLHQKDGAVAPRISREEAVQQLKDLGYPAEEAEAKVAEWEEPAPAAAEAPAAEAPAVEEEVVEREEPDNLDVLLEAVKSYLGGVDALELDIREWLEVRLGAEPEAAAIAVGRLAAVRDLIRQLVEVSVEAQVEAAVEETPAEPPEPESGPENGEKA